MSRKNSYVKNQEVVRIFPLHGIDSDCKIPMNIMRLKSQLVVIKKAIIPCLSPVFDIVNSIQDCI